MGRNVSEGGRRMGSGADMRCRRKRRIDFDLTRVLLWEWPICDSTTAEMVLESVPEGAFRDSLAEERDQWLAAGCPPWQEWEARKRATR